MLWINFYVFFLERHTLEQGKVGCWTRTSRLRPRDEDSRAVGQGKVDHGTRNMSLDVADDLVPEDTSIC